MSSQWLMVVKDARDAKTVSSEISIEHQSASDVNNNDPDAWAYLRDLSSYFGAGSVGATSLKTMVVDGAVAASGTITLSGFMAGDVLTPGGLPFGPPAPSNHLGTAATYAVLGETAVTNTSVSTALTGDLGINTALGLTGFPPGTFTGTENYANAASAQAIADASTAAVYYAGLPGYVDISAVDLGSHTLTPGHYSYSSSATWTAGPLTFDGQGNPNAQWVIKTGTTLVTPSAASVVLINGANASNIYWVIGSAATLGSSSTLAGTILAGTAISFGTTANLDGRALAYGTAVTFAGASLVTVPTPPAPLPTAQQFAIGGTDTITAANAAAAIDANPAFACVLSATSVGPVITLTSLIPGLVGNLIPISISGDGSVSGPFLTGGTQAGCGDVEEGVE
jgi:Ice-binding-like